MKIPDIWTFKDNEVTSGFDKHVREQLPWYDLASDAVTHIVNHYIPNHGLVYDIGASTGNFCKLLDKTISKRDICYIGIENSMTMADAFQGNGKIVCCDAIEYDYDNYDVAILFLTTMFFPVAKREKYFDLLFDKLNSGGCIIIVDKCDKQSGYLSTVMYRMTLNAKMKTTCAEDILKKEMSLTGIQRPIQSGIIKKYSGKEFFRFGDFAGWVIEKA